MQAGSVRSAGTATGNPKASVKSIQGLVRRRDADILFSESKSDSDDDDDDDDVDQVAKGPIGSPDQGGNLGPEFDDEILAKPKRPFYKRRQFWVFAIMLSWTLLFVAVGVCFFKPSDDITKVQYWRICFFLAGLPLIWYTGDFVTIVIVWAVERSMFTVKNALYFAYAVRKPLRGVIRALLTLGWWPLIMTVDYTGQQSDTTLKVYTIILRIWACVSIFMVANLIKVLLGKMLALKFNQESHLNKMYAALKKEQWLHCLLVPRPSFAEPEMLESGHSGLGGSTAQLFSKFRISRSASDGDAAYTLEKAHSEGSGGFGKQDEENQLMPRRSSSGLSDKLKFWRKSRTQLDIITEESARHVEVTGGTGEKTSSTTSPTSGREDVSITIDSVLPASPPPASAVLQSPRAFPPVQVDSRNNKAASNSGTTSPDIRIPNPLESDSAGPADPLPPREAIDAAYASQKIKKNQTASGALPAAAATTSPAKQSRFCLPFLLRSRNTATDNTVSANNTATTLKQHNKGIAVGGMPDFGSGPMRKDEVMTRLARLERYMRKKTLEVTFRDALNNTETLEVTNESEAKRVGLILFRNVKSVDAPVISKEDLEEFIPDDELDDAYAMLDDDEDGVVTVEDCISAVENICQQRANLVASLKDTRSIASSLEVVIGIILHFLCFMVYLYILFSIALGQIWIFISTIVLGLSFIFGQYISTTLENTMFLFNSHPFDVGDMLYVENDFLMVDEMQMNFTICINSCQQRQWVPNQSLVSSSFINLTTSGNRTESINVLVDMDTPPRVLEDVVAAMTVLKEEQPQEYAVVGGCFRDAAVPMKMTMRLFYDFPHSGTNLPRSRNARSRMYICVAAALQKAGVAYTLPAMRTLDLPAQGNIDRAAAVVAAAASDPNTSSVIGVL